jgi:hypothetical protein
MYEATPDAILETMVANKEKFRHIESLFVGDMESEENEISWIFQGNYSEIWVALPNLKTLKIQGSENTLKLGEKIEHANLEEFQIICGGLPARVVNSLKTAKLSNLKKLVLYLGVENYGYDCEITDFSDLAKKDLLPSLKYLGFVNSEEQDEIAKIVLESDILPQLETLDFSFGTLTDKGGQLILDSADKLKNLKTLKIEWHYMSDEMCGKLEALPFEVSISDAQTPDEYDGETYTYPMITE